MPTVPVFEYLAAPRQHPPAAVNVLFGDEPFLRRLALAQLREGLAAGREEVQLTTYDADTPWRDVNDELSTGSLFGGGGRRLVLIDSADSFVSTHRAKLEDYVAKPKSSAALILAVDTWPANTKLFKAVEQSGFQVACGVPVRPNSRNKDPDLPKLSKWIVAWAKSAYKIALESSAADELVHIVGPELGIIDQDLAKLALYVPSGGHVTVAHVKEIVGGWRMRTAWQMMDDVTDGKAAAALEEFDHLLRSGSEPIAIFAQVSHVLRRYAAATRIVQRQQRAKQRIDLGDAAKQAGFRAYGDELKKAERQLKQLTAVRAGKLYQWLLETDLALKGSHSHKERARLKIEMLFMKLAAKEQIL